MKRLAVVFVALVTVPACAPDDAVAPTIPTAEATAAPSASTPDPTSATQPEIRTTTALDRDDADGDGPRYDVFLAAVAEAVAGTRFAETPFESPEVVISTGLALCEAIEDGIEPDSVVFEYLMEITEGDPESADDDQLVLAGALIGGAEVALCQPNR